MVRVLVLSLILLVFQSLDNFYAHAAAAPFKLIVGYAALNPRVSPAGSPKSRAFSPDMDSMRNRSICAARRP